MKAIEFIAEVLMIKDMSKINLDSSLVKDLRADELDLIEIVMKFEDVYEIEISDEEWEKCFTIEHVLKLLASKGVSTEFLAF